MPFSNFSFKASISACSFRFVRNLKRQIDQFFPAHVGHIVLGHRDPILPNLAIFEEGVSRYFLIIEHIFY